MLFGFFFAFLLFPSFAETLECPTQYSQPINIPYIKVENENQYFYCFGYHHGKDRAWQMDYFRRVGQGRNAEIYGFSHLKSDLMMRLLDLPSLSEKIWKNFSPQKKRWLEAYSKGVNQGLKIGKKAPEFKDKGYLPEKWKPQHTLLVLLLQSFDQTRKTFFRDYQEENLKKKWGDKAQALFSEDDVPWNNTILKEGEYPKRKTFVWTQPESNVISVKLWSDFPSLFGVKTGSNNWAVSKEKSTTGHAIFANDPHLDLRTPLFWYWISLSQPEGKVIGASLPGVPVIVSGTNGRVAWGLTNSYLNSADAIFVKDLEQDDIISIRPVVWVKFWFLKLPFFFKSFEKLKSGHRVLPLETENTEKIILRWTGFHLSPEDIYPMFDLFKVQDVTDMDHLISKVGVPSWNFVFADQKGDIGYRMVGKTYKHEDKLPFGISTLNRSQLQNENYLKPQEIPHLLRPSRNYVYSANNRHWPKDAKFYGGRGYSFSYRGKRIDELLSKRKHDVESFKNIQCDRRVNDAKFFLTKLKKYLTLSDMNESDLFALDDSRQLPHYRRLMDLIKENWEVNEYALYRLLDNLTPQQITEMKSFYQKAKKDIKGRTWKEILRLKFSHLSKNESWAFSPEIPGVGDSHSVDPGTSVWNEEEKIYEQLSGASMRLIIEMDKTPRIWLSLPGLNREYDNKTDFSPWDDWRACKYLEVKY